MSTPMRRCPKCLKIMPLARRRCPYCRHIIHWGEETQSIEVAYLQNKLSGSFDILSEIERKGTSVIFKAHDLILDYDVIIKTLYLGDDLDENLLNRWELNAKRATRLDQRNILKCFTFGQAGPIFYFICEFTKAKTLADILPSANAIPIFQSLRIARDIAWGAQFAHHRGIVHHRIKPSNIAILNNDHAKIMDFGSAGEVIHALNQKPWSREMENPYYFAPEQIETGYSDEISDQYAIGVILFQMLTGILPFGDGEKEVEEIAFSRVDKNSPSIRDYNVNLPVELENIVLKVLSKNPEDRYPNCRYFVHALESLDPEYWTPEFALPNDQDSLKNKLESLLSASLDAEKKREFKKAMNLCEQAVILSPYDTKVTETLLRLKKLSDRADEVRCLINKGCSAFYEKRLETALNMLNKAKQLDHGNPDILRLTHAVLQEQERMRLIRILIHAARSDLAQNAITQAMAKVIKLQDIDPDNKEAEKLKHIIDQKIEDKATAGILISKADQAIENGHIEEAEELLTRVITIFPEHPESLRLKQRILQEKKHIQLSILKSRVHVAIKNSDYSKAINLLKEMMVLEPELKNDIVKRINKINKIIETSKDQIVFNREGSLKETEASLQKNSDKEELVQQEKENVFPEIQNIDSGHSDVFHSSLNTVDLKNNWPNNSLHSEPNVQAISVEKESLQKEDFENIEKALPFSLEPDKIGFYTRTLLLIFIGIFLVVFVSIFLHVELHDKRPSNEHISTVEKSAPVWDSTVVSTNKFVAIPANTPLPETAQIFPTQGNLYPTPTIFSLDLKIKRLRNKAEHHEQQGDWEQALIFYKKILFLKKTDIKAQAGAARCERYYKKKRRPSAGSNTKEQFNFLILPSPTPGSTDFHRNQTFN